MLWQDKEKVNEYAFFVNGAVFIDFCDERNTMIIYFNIQTRTRDSNRITQLKQAGTLSN